MAYLGRLLAWRWARGRWACAIAAAVLWLAAGVPAEAQTIFPTVAAAVNSGTCGPSEPIPVIEPQGTGFIVEECEKTGVGNDCVSGEFLLNPFSPITPAGCSFLGTPPGAQSRVPLNVVNGKFSTAAPIDVGGEGDSVVGGLINQDAGASNGSGKDPNFDFVDTLNHGSSISSASGAFSGTLSSRTIDLNAGANGGFRPSWLFNLSADGMQTLVVGGAFDHDWQQTSYGSSFAATATRSIYSFGPYARYDVGDVYLYGAAEGLLGSGSENNAATGGSGSFGTAGFAAAAKLGRTFMLFDALDYGAPLDALDYGAPPPPTRHRPRPIGGYGLQLDVSGHGGYFDDRAGGFTDTVGFVNGTQQYHYGFVGVTAKLLATVATGNRLIWYPFLALTVDQKLGFTHTLDVPAQAGFGGDVLSFNEAQTTGTLAAGIGVLDISGISVGVQGFYRHGSNIDAYGARIAVDVPLGGWLGLGSQASR